MPWAWKVNLKNPDGTPITIKKGLRKPKEVPGCIVDWMDSKGYIRHTLSPVYVSGKRKGMPKNSIYGCFTEETGWQPTAKDDDDADELRKEHNRKSRRKFYIKRPRTKIPDKKIKSLLSGRRGKAITKPKKTKKAKNTVAKKPVNEVENNIKDEKQTKLEAAGGYIARKPWDEMTDEQKIYHARTVLELENYPVIVSLLMLGKNNNKKKDEVILQRYEELSDEIKNRHLP